MKNLFTNSIAKYKFTIIGASVLIFAVCMGYIIYETTKSTVEVTLDGEVQTVTTHSNTVEGLLDSLDITLSEKDYVFPSKDTKITNDLEVEWKPAKQVHIVKDNEKKTVWTVSKTVNELLSEQNITIGAHDKVYPNLDENIENNLEVNISLAFPVTINDGGKTSEVYTTSSTVGEFIGQQGIVLNELDRIENDETAMIKANDTINIIRVEKVNEVVEEKLEYATITKKDSSLLQGSQKVITKGQEGLVNKEYEVIKENGVVVSKTLKKETKIKDTVDKVVAVGTQVAVSQASRGEATSGKELTVTATAYTASCTGCSGVTATGINLKNNPDLKVIAVDPNVIPLGTKVYVEGYGYAVAGDTGGAIKGNKIDVFFPNKSQAYNWGRKTVKIRIL